MVVGELSQERDLIIIGGGPGGYTAAIRAAQLGLEVSLIEQSNLGGNCLHKACIPSKIWAHTAKKRLELEHIKELGLEEVNPVTLNLAKLRTYQAKKIAQLAQGIKTLLRTNQIELIRGKAVFTAEDRLGVELGHQFDIYQFKQVIIATGSTPTLPSNLAKLIPQHSNRVLLAESIFQLEEIPKRLLVLGSDLLALEVASTFKALGSQVTLLAKEGDVFPLDISIEREIKRLFKKRKISIKTYAELLTVEEKEQQIQLALQNSNGEELLVADYLFLSGERRPNVSELGIVRFGIKETEQGFLDVNGQLQTNLANVYAIGDVTAGPPLAIKAIKQGKIAAEVIAGRHPELDLTFLPLLVHTQPPIVSVGLTEQKAIALGMDIRVSHIPLSSNGYAHLTGHREGLIKVISDNYSELLLGIHMIGEGAIELSSHFVQLLEMAAKEEDALFPLYAHPSINESLLEAVEGLTGLAIHSV